MNSKEIGMAVIFLALAAYSLIWMPLGYVSYYFGFLFAGASVITFIKGLKGKKKK